MLYHDKYCQIFLQRSSSLVIPLILPEDIGIKWLYIPVTHKARIDLWNSLTEFSYFPVLIISQATHSDYVGSNLFENYT